MRNEVKKWRKYHPLITYRGAEANRVDNLTDAVFGIAITLLIFNLNNPNSFSDLEAFAKTLPAFLLSISFLVLVWHEHFRFSEIYGLADTWLIVINTFFLALIIFYVYPLRFLSLYLSSLYVGVDVGISISGNQVPDLMIYYGFIAFALYGCLFLLYFRAGKIKSMGYSDFEKWFTRIQLKRMVLMLLVPLISIVVCFSLKKVSIPLASLLSGLSYSLYGPAMGLWQRKYKKEERQFSFSNE